MTEQQRNDYIATLSPMVSHNGDNSKFQKGKVLINRGTGITLLCLSTNGSHSTYTDDPNTFVGLVLVGYDDVEVGDVECWCKALYKESDLTVEDFKDTIIEYQKSIDKKYGVGRVVEHYWN